MNALSSIEYPHWLMIAGAVLLVLGRVGLALGQRSMIESHAKASEQEPPEPEGDVDQVEVYNRTAKEKRKDRWAERFSDPEEPVEKFGPGSK
jgi:hypothetical protein